MIKRVFMNPVNAGTDLGFLREVTKPCMDLLNRGSVGHSLPEAMDCLVFEVSISNV